MHAMDDDITTIATETGGSLHCSQLVQIGLESEMRTLSRCPSTSISDSVPSPIASSDASLIVSVRSRLSEKVDDASPVERVGDCCDGILASCAREYIQGGKCCALSGQRLCSTGIAAPAADGYAAVAITGPYGGRLISSTLGLSKQVVAPTAAGWSDRWLWCPVVGSAALCLLLPFCTPCSSSTTGSGSLVQSCGEGQGLSKSGDGSG